MKKLKLLLVDNSEIFREGLVKLLEHEPSIEVVSTCGMGLEAVESAHEHQPDVILMDMELDECGGIEVMRRIHERLPETNIIVLTCSEASADFFSAVKAGARGYVAKDISLETLIKTIVFVAEGGVIVSPPMATRLLAEFNLLEKHKDGVEVGDVTLLSKREQAVLSLVAKGFTNKEIATTLVISENTAKVHLRNIMEKLHAHTRQQAVALMRENDLLPRFNRN